jgi:protein TonB
MARPPTSRSGLRRQYRLHLQIGAILTLLLLIFLARLDLHPARAEALKYTQDIPPIAVEIPQTVHPTPQPPRPLIPTVVPDNSLIEADDLGLDPLFLQRVLPEIGPPPEPPEPEVSDPESDAPFVLVEQMPELEGGLAGLQKKIKYPEIAKKAGVEGRVFVQFIVDEQGNVTNPEVVRGIGAGCDEEALRALRTAKFTPGKQRGKAVRVKMTLPVTFRLK